MTTTATPISRQIATGQLEDGSARSGVNVNDWERLASIAGGGLLVFFGLRDGSALGLGLAALGGGLIYRGATGHCHVYEAIGVNTAQGHSKAAAVGAGEGFKIVKSITVNKSPAELFRIWHNFEGLPNFMDHLVSVKSEGNRSHWVAKGPVGNVEWDAEIVNDVPDRLIAWRSLEGSQVSTAGSVRFQAAPFGGTEIQVELKYDPPAGKLGSWVAWLAGQDPGKQIDNDLRRFKELVESNTFTAGPTHTANRVM